MEHPLSSDWSRSQLICHLIELRQLQQHQLQQHQLTEEYSQILMNLQFGLVLVCFNSSVIYLLATLTHHSPRSIHYYSHVPLCQTSGLILTLTTTQIVHELLTTKKLHIHQLCVFSNFLSWLAYSNANSMNKFSMWRDLHWTLAENVYWWREIGSFRLVLDTDNLYSTSSC